jgi:hypothetical protein
VGLSSTESTMWDTLPEAIARAADAIRTATIIDGRGRAGKTTVANVFVQFCRERGANLRVWNADRQNETHSLSVFHPDAIRPPSDDPDDKGAWLEESFDAQVQERFDSVLDLAGGDPLVRLLARETELVGTLERRGVRTVLWQVLGPDVADLDYLKLSMESGLFAPATLLVLNAGLVRSKRSVEAVFAEVTEHKVFIDAVARGAQVVWFPGLVCMNRVAERGLTFGEAKQGIVKPGQQRFALFDQTRVEIFWEKHIPAFFAQIPGDWLPAMNDGEAPSKGVVE